MTNLAKVFLPQTKQRRAVKFCVAADIVIRMRMQWFSRFVVPDFFRVVMPFDIYFPRIPVFDAAPDEIAALVSWLASDEASNVSGAIVTADNGWTAA